MMMTILPCCNGGGVIAPRKRSLFSQETGSDDAVLITVTGFDHQGFSWFLQQFKEVYDNTTVLGKYDYIIHPKEKTKGRPRLLDGTDCLGLILVWTCTRGH
eukprot:11612096-Ditylum_brightwellii.AAC.1